MAQLVQVAGAILFGGAFLLKKIQHRRRDAEDELQADAEAVRRIRRLLR